MMYTEFIEGTGCRENDHNYKVYKDLEVMYMNSDLTKEEIYEYGKKLVDNSKSEEQIAVEKKIEAQIDYFKHDIDLNKGRIEFFDCMIKNCESAADMVHAEEYRREKKFLIEANKQCRRKIKELKWLLAM